MGARVRFSLVLFRVGKAVGVCVGGRLGEAVGVRVGEAVDLHIVYLLYDLQLEAYTPVHAAPISSHALIASTFEDPASARLVGHLLLPSYLVHTTPAQHRCFHSETVSAHKTL